MKHKKTTTLALGAAISLSLSAAPLFAATSTPFEMASSKNSFLVASAEKTDKKEETAKDKSTDAKMKEGKCGAESKAKDGKCGSKMAETQKAESKKSAEDKMKEGKCGEGACGASMKKK